MDVLQHFVEMTYISLRQGLADRALQPQFLEDIMSHSHPGLLPVSPGARRAWGRPAVLDAFSLH